MIYLILFQLNEIFLKTNKKLTVLTQLTGIKAQKIIILVVQIDVVLQKDCILLIFISVSKYMNQLVSWISDILDGGSIHQEYILHFIWKTSQISLFIKLKTTDKASVVPFNAVSGFKRICSLSETQRHGTLISIQTLDNLTT